MTYTLEDVKHEWKGLVEDVDFQEYLHTYYVPVYTIACEFIGYRRSTEHERHYDGIC